VAIFLGRVQRATGASGFSGAFLDGIIGTEFVCPLGRAFTRGKCELHSERSRDSKIPLELPRLLSRIKMYVRTKTALAATSRARSHRVIFRCKMATLVNGCQILLQILPTCFLTI
jgi:hypothetical protein